ncbi:uncharacterized protein LOC117341823 [Pecten maximus]|uniref:uncharacterized protein LOC117341823 n=1 Tax=Pecten maximus TaxID=6579 RepID=UPI0014589501|nr:uncharacterized protein LOC117341823 [Pecten maximus]
MSLSKQLKPSIYRPELVKVSDWRDDMREWPEVLYGDIYNYLVKNRAVDESEMQNFKSFDSFNYFKSGSVGKSLHAIVDDDLVLLKAEVRPSQKANEKWHSPWVLCGRNGFVYTGECSCVAGLSKTCSHVGALLWKVEHAVRMNLTGKSCTDEQVKWNMGTTRNIEPGLINNMDFQKPKRRVEEKEFECDDSE